MKVEHKKYGFKGEITFDCDYLDIPGLTGNTLAVSIYPKVQWRNNVMSPFSLWADFSSIIKIIEATTIQLNKLRPFQPNMVSEFEERK